MAKNNISEKARLTRNAYVREWRKRNPEKVLATQERYWERKAVELEAKKREGANG